MIVIGPSSSLIIINWCSDGAAFSNPPNRAFLEHTHETDGNHESCFCRIFSFNQVGWHWPFSNSALLFPLDLTSYLPPCYVLPFSSSAMVGASSIYLSEVQSSRATGEGKGVIDLTNACDAGTKQLHLSPSAK